MSPSTDQRENREFAAEVKFLVTGEMAQQIRAWARARLLPDPHANDESGDGYTVTSHYFDTERLDVFERNGSFGRSKYRIRRYGAGEVVFLERKLKTKGLVSKRRSAVRATELTFLANEEPDRAWAGYWFHRRLQARRLAPVCQIAYRRSALVQMTNLGPIRLTIDQNLRALDGCGLQFHPPDQGTACLDGQAILELKYRFEMPLLFKLLAEEFLLNPQPISKYRLGVGALGLAPDSEVKEQAGKSPEGPLCLNS